jgi:hypothetical protein
MEGPVKPEPGYLSGSLEQEAARWPSGPPPHQVPSLSRTCRMAMIEKDDSPTHKRVEGYGRN